MKGKDIAIQQEMKEINEKVDRMYQKLFPPSVGELREDVDRVFDKEEKKEEKPVERPPEKKEEPKKEDDIKKDDRLLEKKEEHKEEKPVENIENPSEIDVMKREEKIEKKAEDSTVSPHIDNPNLISSKELLENKGLNDKLLIESSEEKENWPWQEEVTDKDVSKGQDETEVPKEVNDKLGMLLQEDEGQRQAVQYLINKYNKNKGKKVGDTVNNKKSDDKSAINNGTGSSIVIIPSEDVVRIGRAGGKGKEKGEPYKMYDVAIHPFIQDILKSIEGSKDGMIRVRLIDIAKKMGEKFIDKKHVTVYTGLKYTLFDHNIVVEMGSLKAVDPVTKENIKILKMRMKNSDDMLPPSLLERRGYMD